MSTDEYTPSGDDERIAHAYAEVVHLGSEGMVSRDEAVGEFYVYLAAHDARVRRDAARSALDGLAAELMEAARDCAADGDHGGAGAWRNASAHTYHHRDTHYPETED